MLLSPARFSLLAASGALALFTADSARATVLLDDLSNYENGAGGAGLYSIGTTPNILLGDAYSLPAGTTDITGFDFYADNNSGTSFDGLVAIIWVWGAVNSSGTVNSNTLAFSDLLGEYSFRIASPLANGSFLAVEGASPGVTPGVTLAAPLMIPTTTVGISLNIEGSVNGTNNYYNYNNLTPMLSAGTVPTVGTQTINGVYDSPVHEFDGNFSNPPSEFGQTDAGLALRIYDDGAPAPEPVSLALLAFGGLALFWRRRSV